VDESVLDAAPQGDAASGAPKNANVSEPGAPPDAEADAITRERKEVAATSSDARAYEHEAAVSPETAAQSQPDPEEENADARAHTAAAGE
jgi:hypothetical protein